MLLWVASKWRWLYLDFSFPFVSLKQPKPKSKEIHIQQYSGNKRDEICTNTKYFSLFYYHCNCSFMRNRALYFKRRNVILYTTIWIMRTQQSTKYHGMRNSAWCLDLVNYHNMIVLNGGMRIWPWGNDIHTKTSS